MVTTKEQHKAWRDKNKDKIHKYYLKKKEERIAKSRENYYSNREHKIEKQKEWSKSNRDKVRQYHKDWKKNNRDKYNVQQQTRRKYGRITGDCQFCHKPATHRHHDTIPYHVDKFILCCEQCHKIFHRKNRREED